MASGNSLWTFKARSFQSPSTDFATLHTILDGSTPPIVFQVLDFRGATGDEHTDIVDVVPSYYDGGGFTFQYWGAVDGTDVDIIELEFRMITLAQGNVLTGDLELDTQTEIAIQDTPIATSTDKLMVSGTGNLSHANAGSPAAKAGIVLRITRDITAATNTDDFQLLMVHVTET